MTKINVITTGCSFTARPDSWSYALASTLSENYNVINVSNGGTGQDTIVREALIKLQETQGPKICIAQFSSHWRFDIHVRKQDNDYFDSIVKEEQDWEAGPNYFGQLHEEFIIVKTTKGKHNNKNIVSNKLIKNIEETINEEQRLCWTYESISQLQMYCKLNNIKLLCFFGWQDCIPQDTKHFTLAHKISKLVDWNNFWFYKNKGGMAEWMLDNGHRGKPEEDTKGWYMFEGRKRIAGHPTAEAHTDFCKQIIKPWIEND